MNSFKIVEFLNGEKSTFYSILFENELYTEADKFFDKNSSIKPFEIETIVEKINQMANKNGCQDIYFEPDSSLTDLVCKIKINDVRLYCLRYSNIAVIIGGGGIKDPKKKKTQDNPELQKHVDLLKHVFELIEKRIKENEISFTSNELIGNLEFDLT